MATLATRDDYATVRPLPAVAGRDAITLASGVVAHGTIVPVARDAAIFAQEDEVAHVYKVISGAVRVTRLLADGRRHIVAFYFAGELFGLEAGDTHQFAAEAVVASRIAFVRRSAVASEAEHSGDAMWAVWRLMAQELGRAQDHALVLGRLNAEERVAAFLRDMAARAGSGDSIDLPMSRTDIADYLGLTIETVSRTLTHMERLGAIRFAGARRIHLRGGRPLAKVA
ncbi:MAG: helix-turn-helix domain-containing protein [Hyphomonadaceae bacterium]|nr:MAG: CRP/FNR family transcriptional regulator nitrogen fixation regulation protein [Caulobacteraceae bacterium]MBT9446977.1 helix-turn-helix domain-containing protein [Hyphomonadaceae bacterium]TPW08152.1 MAG: CRP/FNR family transcriptional regulator, nitrogen fixation regulation protein [Alphaproteobacteria bacterium]